MPDVEHTADADTAVRHKGFEFRLCADVTFRKEGNGASSGAAPKLQKPGRTHPASPLQKPLWENMDGRYADFSACFSLPAYFLLNLSTRPAVSMIFCFPVMKGWH
jgi:hypothetical protein